MCTCAPQVPCHPYAHVAQIVSCTNKPHMAQDRNRDDPYERAAARPDEPGQSSLGAAFDASAAVAHAAALAGPQGYTCDTCQVPDFTLSPTQHLPGAGALSAGCAQPAQQPQPGGKRLRLAGPAGNCHASCPCSGLGWP